MKVGNISFGTTYYEGYSKFKSKDKKEEYHFETLGARPKRLLTEDQNNITKIIENELYNTKVDCILKDSTKANLKIYLDTALFNKNTDIYFRYPNENVVETELIKWGVNKFGDVYEYNPYNKNGNKKIKMTFSLDKILSYEKIINKTEEFISDCKIYLSDNDNIKNKKIEKNLKNNIKKGNIYEY